MNAKSNQIEQQSREGALPMNEVAEQGLTKTSIVSKALFIVFWILAIFPFTLQEISMGIYEKVETPIRLACDGVLLLLALWTIKNRLDIILAGTLIVLSFSSSVLNNIGLAQWANGVRIYLPLVTLLPIVRYLLATRARAMDFLRKMDRTLFIFLVMQVPCMIYQCFLYGAYDNVGGSLGWMMSGTISSLIYAISFYLMLRHWDNGKSYLENLKSNWVLIFLLFPSYLNETKISFIFLAFYFLFLVPFDRNFMKRILVVLPVMLVMVMGAGWFYIKMVVPDENIFTAEYLETYLQGDDEMQSLVMDNYLDQDAPDVNETDFGRGLKMAVLPDIFNSQPSSWIYGFGGGQFKGGREVDVPKFAQQYEWFLQGTWIGITMFAIELGILGLLWLVGYMIVLFRPFRRVAHREKRLQMYVLLIMVLNLFYGPSFIYVVYTFMLTYMAFVGSRWKLTAMADEKNR